MAAKLLASALITVLCAVAEQGISGPDRRDGIDVYRIDSDNQQSPVEVQVLPPDRAARQRYRALYVLPVMARGDARYGDGMAEAKRLNLHNRYGIVVVYPSFSELPWYADHSENRRIRQETFLLKNVLPLIESRYPVAKDPSARLLLGFSKSGWGAFTLLLRHPNVFGCAASWDAPSEKSRPDQFGMGDIFGTQENFERYHIAKLLEDKAAQFRGPQRFILLGYGNFRDQVQATHQRMQALGIPHRYRDRPQRKHEWGSGWVEEAAAELNDCAQTLVRR